MANKVLDSVGLGTLWAKIKDLVSTKSEVSVTRNLTGGTKVAELTIDGETTSLYAPSVGDKSLNHYGICDTAASTLTKTVTVNGSFSLGVGVEITVKFAHTNTVSSPKLNVNGTGAIGIVRYSNQPAGANLSTSWKDGAVLKLTYDGTYWVITSQHYTNATSSVAGLMSSTHYSAVNGATDTPTASKISKFDSSSHINSKDMSASDVTSFVNSLSGTPISPADYVVETGTHNLWKYVKWNSGRIELWGKFEQTVTSYATNAWVIGHASLTNYPSGITNPIAVATCQKIGTGGGTVCYDYERTDYWSGIANNFNGTIAQGESRTISWYVYVNARWK